MATASATPPISYTRLKQVSNDACQSALGGVEAYEHSKTEAWNTTIINSILKALLSESSQPQAFKYVVNSTVIQHNSALNKSKPSVESAASAESSAKISTSNEKPEAISTDGNAHVGRRGMHSATGAYWNEKTDGMWSFKYEGGENKGLDVVISVIWIAI